MRRGIKLVIYLVCMAIVFPLAVTEWIARRAAGHDVWFVTHGELLSLLPGKTGHWFRNAYYHLTLRKCPLGCGISFGTYFTHAEAEVGKSVYIGTRCLIGIASIGDDTMLADHVQVLSGQHQHTASDPSRRMQDEQQVFTRVRISRNSWVGTNVVVMADIGDQCIVGAGSVVTPPSLTTVLLWAFPHASCSLPTLLLRTVKD